MSNNRIFAITAAIVVVSLTACSAQESVEVCCRNVCVLAELASSVTDRAQGLMFRKKLEKGRGMLFAFETQDYHSFWMKNTLIALDMIWIDENLRIADIKENVPPCRQQECPVYTPARAGLYVLEVPAGFSAEHNWTAADEITIRRP